MISEEHAMITTIAPALKALVEDLFDYAGTFPPAGLKIDDALENYGKYRKDDLNWMLRWFVVNAADLEKIPQSLNGCLSLLGSADNARAATLESTAVVEAARPVYCEVPIKSIATLDEVKSAGNFAKIRTGGVKPEAIPTPAEVAAFIVACAERRLPFKATAGLHHPIRAEQALTYEQDAPRAVMHGFINVLMASAFAWHGETHVEPIVAEMDAKAFRFDEKACWNDKSLTVEQIRDARKNFMHAIGSCSFEEPIQDLRALGLL
jgi:hypothetical protein